MLRGKREFGSEKAGVRLSPSLPPSIILGALLYATCYYYKATTRLYIVPHKILQTFPHLHKSSLLSQSHASLSFTSDVVRMENKPAYCYLIDFDHVSEST